MAPPALLRRLLAALRSRRAMAALEFGIIAPVFALAMAGGIDIGSAVLGRYRLDAAVTAAANYAIVNAAQIEATDGATLAANIAAIVANNNGANWAVANVTVNNGPTAGVSSTGNSSSGSTAAIASCYCPTGSGTAITWGNAVACGGACPAGGTAGQFVVISGTYSFTPLFSSYGFVPAGNITVASVVQTK